VNAIADAASLRLLHRIAASQTFCTDHCIARHQASLHASLHQADRGRQISRSHRCIKASRDAVMHRCIAARCIVAASLHRCIAASLHRQTLHRCIAHRCIAR
jgi:predicted RNA-binding protein YlqC (UPF0109 family)